MNTKSTLLSHSWSADEAHKIISFLDQLGNLLWDAYGVEIIEQHRHASNHDDRQLPLEIEEIPFE